MKTKQKGNEKRSNISSEGSATDSPKPSGFLKVVRELEKIDKFSGDCKRPTKEKANLKRTIQYRVKQKV